MNNSLKEITGMHNRKLIGFLHVLLLSGIMNAYAQPVTETNDTDIRTKKDTTNVLTSPGVNNLRSQEQQDFQNSVNNTENNVSDSSKKNVGLNVKNTKLPEQDIMPVMKDGKNSKMSESNSDAKQNKSLAEAEAEIENLKLAQKNLKNEIDKLTKAMYLSGSNFGEKNGPGYYYRFTAEQDAKKTYNNFYYVIKNDTKKESRRGAKLQKAPPSIIKKNDFVTFELTEMLPDNTIISQTPLLTVLNDDHLPNIVKAAFSVGKAGETVIIAALAKQVYGGPEKDNLPKEVFPDTSIIYQFKLINSHNADSRDLNVLRVGN